LLLLCKASSWNVQYHPDISGEIAKLENPTAIRVITPGCSLVMNLDAKKLHEHSTKQIQLDKLFTKHQKVCKYIQSTKEQMEQPEYITKVPVDIQNRTRTRYEQLQKELLEINNAIQTSKGD